MNSTPAKPSARVLIAVLARAGSSPVNPCNVIFFRGKRAYPNHISHKLSLIFPARLDCSGKMPCIVRRVQFGLDSRVILLNNRVDFCRVTGQVKRMTRKKATSDNYRKPPVEHQFKRGKSGNPNGRPPKKAVQPGSSALGGGIADRLADMALEEATRPVTVREGDKVSEMPAMQAVLRTMYRAAAQGDTKAARQLIDLISRAESGRTSTASETFDRFVEYKRTHGPIFEKREREGLPPPDVFPHPDDVIINFATGEVSIEGPTTKEEAGAQNVVRELALNSLSRYPEVLAALKKQPKNTQLRRELKKLKGFYKFLEKDAERTTRHKALRQARRAAEKQPGEPETGKEAPNVPNTTVRDVKGA
jgi:hypothetical protein